MKKSSLKYAVLNIKGGVGKSTVAVHIAHGLAIKGKKVLLIDMDGQNDTSLFLGISLEEEQKGIDDLTLAPESVRPVQCIIRARKNLDILPSRQIDRISEALYREDHLQNYFALQLRSLEELEYDFIIMDCGPRRNRMNDAVLFYANKIIVPVQVEAASVKAVGDIYAYLADLNLDFNMISMVVPNMFDRRTSDGKENLEFLKEFFSNSKVVTEPIYRRVKITQTGKFGMTVFETDKESAGQFDQLVMRMVRDNG